MITNKDIRVENGFLIINGNKYPLDGQSPEAIMEIVEDNSDTTPTENSTAPITSGGVYTALGTKQDTLTFDTVPTGNSTNPVESGGVYSELATINQKIDAHSLGAIVEITSYDATDNRYTCTTDGYVKLVVSGGGSAWVYINGQILLSSAGSSSGHAVAESVYVKKGMTVYMTGASSAALYFAPII